MVLIFSLQCEELEQQENSSAMKDLAIAANDYGVAAQINFKYGDYENLKVSDAIKNVKLEVIKFDAADVITTSDGEKQNYEGDDI